MDILYPKIKAKCLQLQIQSRSLSMLALTAETPDRPLSEWTTVFPAGRSAGDVITHVGVVISP